MKIIFLIALIFLCLNVARFIVSAIIILWEKDIKVSLKGWNLVESLAMVWVLVELILAYYR